MKRALFASLSAATLLHVAPSLAAYDFQSDGLRGGSQTIRFAVERLRPDRRPVQRDTAAGAERAS